MIGIRVKPGFHLLRKQIKVTDSRAHKKRTIASTKMNLHATTVTVFCLAFKNIFYACENNHKRIRYD